ncbi:ABC transporter [Prauserella sp. PE36]|uniref:sugar ABC transporter ATP-binding protein n=1 Tax=Prauserella sp. PE36 TaxID=1504709 RepID=UPI000DE35A6F|nr:sugar ABC transporter ATP-binding protein [Prauserella sp. PE36]RBM21846.1 ABC transporter [Prauserella sp. PE36]
MNATELVPPGQRRPTSAATFVEVQALTKTYGAIRALKGVNIAFRRGEVHGLVGANGAGKSTLVRSLAGLEQPDSGSIRIDGVETQIPNPSAATKLGLAFIHQELNLVETFTASQNIMLGSHEGAALAYRRIDGVHPTARTVATMLGIDFRLDRPVARLTVHQKWLVSIARALVHDCRLIAMDEPTASLGAEESARLLKVARDLADHGVAVLFISHRLDEVLELCDRVTAFRDGGVSATMQGAEATRRRLVEAIVGHEAAPSRPASRVANDDRPVVLEVSDVRRGRALTGATLQLREGELLGIAGLVGSGRTELARAIFGADRIDSGTMRLFGRPYAPRSITDGIRHRIGLVSEERRAEALFLDLSVTSNLYVNTWRKHRVRFTPFTSSRRAERQAAEVSQELGVVLRQGGVRQPIGGLSGGNQQKVVIGRWLQTEPAVLLLDEPTRGVDIGARDEIYRRIRSFARAGMSVIVISSEFEELLECDRVVVMSAGATVGELTGASITVKDMLRLCYHWPESGS